MKTHDMKKIYEIIQKTQPTVITMSADIDPKKLKKFQSHKCKFKKKNKPDTDTNASDAVSISYKFSQGSLGISVAAVCDVCGKEKDITDFQRW